MQNPFEDVRNRLNIVDVVSGYLPVKNSGSNYKVVCPFHSEKTGSLMLSPSKNIWHCFGCGLGGDIFKFVELYDNCTKGEALKTLAKQAGVTLTPKSVLTPQQVEKYKENLSQHEKGLQYLDWSANVYHQILLKILSHRDHPVTKYILERGLSAETVAKFKLGYAPKGGQLKTLAQKQGLDIETLEKTGLLRRDDKNTLYDKFSDRLMIPVMDKQSKVVGFTARTLPYDTNENRPKYLNSPQSDWFNKSEIWYGYPQNAASIRTQKKVIIVEGNMDVIKAWQCGFDYTLASQGTSFTSDQLRSLKQISSKVWLAFDNDNAGLIAAKKFFILASQLGIEVLQVVIPLEYKDLDEMFSSGFLTVSTKPFLEDYLARHHAQLLNSDSQRQAILDFLDLVAVVDNITREQYLQKLVSLTGLGYNGLNLQLAESIKNFEKENSHIPNKEIKKDTTLNASRLTQSKNSTILVTFQTLVANSALETGLLGYVFELLRACVSEFQPFVDFESWQTENKLELDLIKENSSDQTDVDKLLQIVISFLDRSVAKFLLDNRLKEVYLELKQSQS